MRDSEHDLPDEAFHEVEPSTELPTLDELQDMADGFGGAAALVVARHPQSGEFEILLVPSGQPIKIGNTRRRMRIEFSFTSSRDTSMRPVPADSPEGMREETRHQVNRVIGAVWEHFHPDEAVSDPGSIWLETGPERDVAMYILSKNTPLTYLQIGRLCDLDNAQATTQALMRVTRSASRYHEAVREISARLGYPDHLPGSHSDSTN